MKYLVDISIFSTTGGAYGNVTGSIDLESTPHVGDTVSFQTPKLKGVLPTPGFSGLLRVKDRVLNVGGSLGTTLALDDLEVATIEDAHAVAEYFHQGFGLDVNTY